MTAKQQPTNAEIMREIKTMQMSIVRIDSRVEALEVVRISNDAVEKYRRDSILDKENQTKLEVLQKLLPFIVALTALAYAIITYLGRVR